MTPNREYVLDLAPYIEDKNDDLSTLIIVEDSEWVEVFGTNLSALITEDFTKTKVTVQVSDGDDQTTTTIRIINPDAPEEESDAPGPGVALAMAAVAVAAVLALRRERRWGK